MTVSSTATRAAVGGHVEPGRVGGGERVFAPTDEPARAVPRDGAARP